MFSVRVFSKTRLVEPFRTNWKLELYPVIRQTRSCPPSPDRLTTHSVGEIMSATLLRPVGLYELALIWDSVMREFPPRLPHQPIFYPVTTAEYARQIARDWNAGDEKSGFAGFVTEFVVDNGYIAKFAPHVVGASQHQEYWIPSEELGAFNKAITGRIGVREAFFGPGFVGCVPDEYLLKGKDAATQMATLAKTWDYSSFDVVCEVSANRKSVYLNCLFWAQHDFAEAGVSQQQRDDFISNLKKAWEFNHIEVPLPGDLSETAARS